MVASLLPSVHYGLSADRLNRTATGMSHMYTASDMCGSLANSYRSINNNLSHQCYCESGSFFTVMCANKEL